MTYFQNFLLITGFIAGALVSGTAWLAAIGAVSAWLKGNWFSGDTFLFLLVTLVAICGTAGTISLLTLF